MERWPGRGGTQGPCAGLAVVAGGMGVDGVCESTHNHWLTEVGRAVLTASLNVVAG